MTTTQCAKCSEALPEDARFCRHCGALADGPPAETDDDPLVGRVVMDRFRIVRVLGEGGMGLVYVAEQRMGATTRAVAIKTLRPMLSADQQLVKRFYREAETVVQLTHPNTIQFFDFGELEDGTLAIVMEYIEGRSLADEIKACGPLDPARVDGILAQVCGSLGEAHQAGIIHRDLKPDNILLTTRGGQQDFVKVLDFGIAKSNEAEDSSRTQLTQQGMVVGTPPYMSPEQFSGEALDPRSDVYSLGVVCYEMLSGKLPFKANTAWEWASQHLTAQPEPLQLTNTDEQIAGQKGAAVARALNKKREDRQTDVMDFLREFSGFDDPRLVYSGVSSVAGADPTGKHRPPSSPYAVTQPVVSPAPTPTDTEALPVLPTRSMGKVWGLASALVLAAAGVGGWLVMEKDGPATTTTASEESREEQVQATGALAPPSPEPNTPALPTAPSPEDATSDFEADKNTHSHKSRHGRSGRRGRHRARERNQRQPEAAKETASPQPAVADPSPQPAKPDPKPVQPPAPKVQAAPPAPVAPPAPTRIVKSVRPPSPMAAPPAPVRTSGPGAQGQVSQIKRLLGSGRVAQAVNQFSMARRQYGANNPTLQSVSKALARAGARQVTQLVQAGKCPQAQTLYRALRSGSVHSGASSAFRGSSCRKP